MSHNQETYGLPQTLPEPWCWTDTDLVRQLLIEIPVGHLLYNKQCTTLARRQDNDDVLFLVSDKVVKGKVYIDWFSGDISFPRNHTVLRWDGVFYTIFEKETVISIAAGRCSVSKTWKIMKMTARP